MGLESFSHGYSQCGFYIVFVPKCLSVGIVYLWVWALKLVVGRFCVRLFLGLVVGCVFCRLGLVVCMFLLGCVLAAWFLGWFDCWAVIWWDVCFKSVLG